MKILIKTFESLIKLNINEEIISTNDIIEQLEKIEQVNKKLITLIYDKIIIKYLINEQYINENSIFFMIIQPYF
jgi:hypothetical protein